MLLCLGSGIAALSVRMPCTGGVCGARVGVLGMQWNSWDTACSPALHSPGWSCQAGGALLCLSVVCTQLIRSQEKQLFPLFVGNLGKSQQQQQPVLPADQADPRSLTQDTPGCCWNGAGGSCRAGGGTSAEPQWGFWVSLAHSSPARVGSKHPAGRHGQLPAARSAWEDNHGFLHTHVENNFHGCSQKQILLCRQGPGCSLLQLFVCFPSSLLIFLLVSFPPYPSPLSPLGVFDLPPLSFYSVSPCDPAPTLARHPAMPS